MERADRIVESTIARRCARCAAAFSCGRDAPDGCWCARLPPLSAGRLTVDAGCLCPECLAALCARQAAEAAAEDSR